MRLILALTLALIVTQAQAKPRQHHYRHAYVSIGLPLSGACRQAAAEGGPCGCWAAEHLLGTSEHVYHGVNVWLASDWLRFRHVAAGPGTAAVMHHHVVPVLADNGSTVTVNDSWGVHEVSKRAVIAFVQPGDGGDYSQHYARRGRSGRQVQFAMNETETPHLFGQW